MDGLATVRPYLRLSQHSLSIDQVGSLGIGRWSSCPWNPAFSNHTLPVAILRPDKRILQLAISQNSRRSALYSSISACRGAVSGGGGEASAPPASNRKQLDASVILRLDELTLAPSIRLPSRGSVSRQRMPSQVGVGALTLSRASQPESQPHKHFNVVSS